MDETTLYDVCEQFQESNSTMLEKSERECDDSRERIRGRGVLETPRFEMLRR